MTIKTILSTENKGHGGTLIKNSAFKDLIGKDLSIPVDKFFRAGFSFGTLRKVTVENGCILGEIEIPCELDIGFKVINSKIKDGVRIINDLELAEVSFLSNLQ